MKTPHKHAELIKAWADGAEIEWQTSSGAWVHSFEPNWNYPEGRYRIKPEPKPDVVEYRAAMIGGAKEKMCGVNMRLIFDGETGKLKSAEVL